MSKHRSEAAAVATSLPFCRPHRQYHHQLYHCCMVDHRRRWSEPCCSPVSNRRPICNRNHHEPLDPLGYRYRPHRHQSPNNLPPTPTLSTKTQLVRTLERPTSAQQGLPSCVPSAKNVVVTRVSNLGRCHHAGSATTSVCVPRKRSSITRRVCVASRLFSTTVRSRIAAAQPRVRTIRAAAVRTVGSRVGAAWPLSLGSCPASGATGRCSVASAPLKHVTPVIRGGVAVVDSRLPPPKRGCSTLHRTFNKCHCYFCYYYRHRCKRLLTTNTTTTITTVTDYFLVVIHVKTGTIWFVVTIIVRVAR